MVSRWRELPCSGRSLDRHEERGTAKEQREKRGAEDPATTAEGGARRTATAERTETKALQGVTSTPEKEKAPNSVGAYFLTFLSYQVRNGLVKERISWVVGQFPGCPSSGPQTILLPIASY